MAGWSPCATAVTLSELQQGQGAVYQDSSPDMNACFIKIALREGWEFCVCKGWIVLDGCLAERSHPQALPIGVWESQETNWHRGPAACVHAREFSPAFQPFLILPSLQRKNLVKSLVYPALCNMSTSYYF